MQADEAVSVQHAEVVDVVPLATLTIGSEEHIEAIHTRADPVRVATWMYCVMLVTSF